MYTNLGETHPNYILTMFEDTLAPGIWLAGIGANRFGEEVMVPHE